MFIILFAAHFVEEAMTRDLAYEYCQSLGRSLPQPKSIAENKFYGQFGHEAFDLLHKDNSTNSKGSPTRKRTTKRLNEAKVGQVKLYFYKYQLIFSISTGWD